MKTFEKEIYIALKHRAEMFLRNAVEKILIPSASDMKQADADNISYICSLLQTAVELACKAYLIDNESIDCILTSGCRGLSKDEMRDKMEKNQIKTQTFDEIKKHLCSKKYTDLLTKEDRRVLEQFEIIRNKTFHFTNYVDKLEYQQLKDRLIYCIVHIIGKVLAYDEDRPSEYLEVVLTSELFEKLIQYEPYVNSMKELAAHDSYEPLCCINCCQETVNLDDDYCYCCNMGYTDIGRLDCPECGTKNAFIYDTLNIHLQGNHHSMPGCCLKCDTHLPVYECPICHQSRILYENGSIQGQCYEGWCETRKQSYKED